ncbi:unnamed protein product [Prunus brigantina]
MTSQVASTEITDEIETADTNWRYPIVKYLRDPSSNHERTTHFRAQCYLIDQNELYRKGSDRLLLLCPSTKEIEKNFSKNFLATASQAESYRSIFSAQVVRFFESHIIHRFGIPETITADNGPVFASAETREYAERMGIKLVHPTPYYPQSNGQVEASNKVIKGILEKMIEEKPWAWQDLLPEALWAYRISKRSATGTSPYALTYGHDAIVPMELKVRSLRVTERPRQDEKNYALAMAQELEDLEQCRVDACNLMQAQK